TRCNVCEDTAMAKVAFCQDIMVEYMGFMYMSACLKQAGHQVEVFFDPQTNTEKFLAEVEAYKPDIVGFSILSPSLSWALPMSEMIKNRTGAVTIFGNVHAIMNPDDIIHHPGADIVCCGEGESPIVELAQCIDEGRSYDHIDTFWVKQEDG